MYDELKYDQRLGLDTAQGQGLSITTQGMMNNEGKGGYEKSPTGGWLKRGMNLFGFKQEGSPAGTPTWGGGGGGGTSSSLRPRGGSITNTSATTTATNTASMITSTIAGPPVQRRGLNLTRLGGLVGWGSNASPNQPSRQAPHSLGSRPHILSTYIL